MVGAFLALTLALPTAQAEPNPSLFAQLNRPHGVATGLDGSVFVNWDAGTAPVVSKLDPNGNYLADLATGDFTNFERVGHLDTDSSGYIWNANPDGTQFLLSPVLDPNDSYIMPNLRQIPQDTSSIYDAASGTIGPMEGINPPFASYGDVAVLNRGNQQDVFVVGRSSGFFFVTRLRYIDYALQSAKVVAASRGQSWTNGILPGIAVNDRGIVTTSMTVAVPTYGDLLGFVPERLLAFSADFPEDGSQPPSLVFSSDFATSGMTNDPFGNFYATGLIGQSSCQSFASGGLVRVNASLNGGACVWGPGASLDQSFDVAISPNGNTAYIGYTSLVARVDGILPQLSGGTVQPPKRSPTTPPPTVNNDLKPFDTTPPEGTVSINGGTKSTRSRSAVLTLSASDSEEGSGVKEMRFSNDGENWSEWEDYAARKSWTLSSSKGDKTVYVEFRDGAGNVSEVAEDEIKLKKGR